MYIISGAVAALSPSWLRSHCCDLIMTHLSNWIHCVPAHVVQLFHCNFTISIASQTVGSHYVRFKWIFSITILCPYPWQQLLTFLEAIAKLHGTNGDDDDGDDWRWQWWWWYVRPSSAHLSPGSPYMCSSVKHMTWLLQVGFLCCQTSLFIVTSHKLLVADWQRWCASRHTDSCTCTC